MCTVNDADIEGVDLYMENKSSLSLIGALCKKCRERKAEVVLRTKDAYCKDCFLASATHKFRAALGKSKLVRPRDCVLIAFSGSQSSVALLHLVNAGMNEASHKRLLFSCTVVYIDEGTVLHSSEEERKDACTFIIHQVKKFGFPVYISSLEQILEDSHVNYNSDDSIGVINSQKKEQLKKLFDSVHSLTAKEDLLQKLRNELLLRLAKQLKCNKIFTADTASHLSVKLLSNISMGRGAQLPLDVGFCDTRDSDVNLLRPMRDFMMKEVVFYNRFNNLTSYNIPSLGTKVDTHASIQRLTEKFVTDLQEDFPATVSTIFRTGDKLSMDKVTTEAEECCALCQAPLDTKTIESSALQATEFSRLVSALGPTGFDDKLIGTLSELPSGNINMKHDTSSHGGEYKTPDEGTSCCNSSVASNNIITKSSCQGECHCSSSSTAITLLEVESCFCYSCRLIAREMKNLETLPIGVITKVKERVRFKEMREEIKDFLL